MWGPRGSSAELCRDRRASLWPSQGKREAACFVDFLQYWKLTPGPCLCWARAPPRNCAPNQESSSLAQQEDISAGAEQYMMMDACSGAGLPVGRHPNRPRNIQALPKIPTNIQTCPENPVTSRCVQRCAGHIQKRVTCHRQGHLWGIFKCPLSRCFQNFPDTITLQPPLGSNSEERRPEKA